MRTCFVSRRCQIKVIFSKLSLFINTHFQKVLRTGHVQPAGLASVVDCACHRVNWSSMKAYFHFLNNDTSRHEYEHHGYELLVPSRSREGVEQLNFKSRTTAVILVDINSQRSLLIELCFTPNTLALAFWVPLVLVLTLDYCTRFHSASPPPPPRAVAILSSAEIQLKKAAFFLAAFATFEALPKPVLAPNSAASPRFN
jgi:hypothetical protein